MNDDTSWKQWRRKYAATALDFVDDERSKGSHGWQAGSIIAAHPKTAYYI